LQHLALSNYGLPVLGWLHFAGNLRVEGYYFPHFMSSLHSIGSDN
jgi:hypothetical protein